MYCYIYDAFIHQNKKLKKTLSQIEVRLADLGIRGKTIKLTRFKNLDESFYHYLDEGIRNFIVIGGDKTFNKLINCSVNHNVVLGLIPMSENSISAKLLGMPFGLEACDLISSRKVNTVNLGKIANERFFSQINFNTKGTNINIDDLYDIKLDDKNDVFISNLIYSEDLTRNEIIKINEKNDLKVVILPKKKTIFFKKEVKGTPSIFFSKNIKITSDDHCPIYSESRRIFKAPILVKYDTVKINVITSKNRLFQL